MARQEAAKGVCVCFVSIFVVLSHSSKTGQQLSYARLVVEYKLACKYVYDTYMKNNTMSLFLLLGKPQVPRGEGTVCIDPRKTVKKEMGMSSEI